MFMPWRGTVKKKNISWFFNYSLFLHSYIVYLASTVARGAEFFPFGNTCIWNIFQLTSYEQKKNEHMCEADIARLTRDWWLCAAEKKTSELTAHWGDDALSVRWSSNCDYYGTAETSAKLKQVTN